MSGTTTNWSRRYPTAGDSPDVPRDIKNLADDLDNVPPITYGPASSRPVSTVGTPGKAGRYYFSTDGGAEGTGVLERDTGTGWQSAGLPGAGEITSKMLADRAKLGVSDSSTVRRGNSIIATAEARTNTAYGLLTTPDRVQSVAMPTDGLMFVSYSASVKESVDDAARAAVFIGANQCCFAEPVNAALNTVNSGRLRSAQGAPGGNMYHAMPTPVTVMESASYTFGDFADLTTGAVLGHSVINGSSPGYGTYPIYAGFVAVYAAAGTWDVSVQYKASGGATVTAKNRKLWVWTMGF